MEEEKQGLLKQIKKEPRGYEKYRKHMKIQKKQKKEVEEKVNVKMQLTIENKGMKRKLMEFLELKKECMELRQKEEAWTEANHAYKKALIKYKHKVEGFERKKQLWLQEQETRKQTIDKMTVQILQMNNVVAIEKFSK